MKKLEVKELPQKQKFRRNAHGFRCQACNTFIGKLAKPENGEAQQEEEKLHYYRVKDVDSEGRTIFYFFI